jgi:hypothetical protein
VNVVLGLAVVAALVWIAVIVGRRVSQIDRIRAASDGLAQAELLREGAVRERAIEVDSPAQIEPRVEREPCLRCGGRIHVEAHEIETIGELVLRRVRAACGGCGARSITWFRVRSSVVH